MSLAPGVRLGPYEIVSPIGAGGMGEVYRARDTRLERDVAVKVLPSYFGKDADRLARFGQEARAAATLNHPNVLVVHDVDVEGPSPYIVTELLEGRTLADLLATGRLATARAVDYAQQLAQGLAAAHGRGVIHRDVKPSNVFITSDGRLKILDFGVAQLHDRAEPQDGPTRTIRGPSTEPGMVMGSVGYMAPEQLRALGADARSDLFAFGCVLYEMLTGQRAFSGATPADTMSAVLSAPPADLDIHTRQSIPAALQRILARCLEKEPVQRFQTATDLAFALQTLALEPSGPVAAPQQTPGGEASSRLRTVAWVATGVAVLSLGTAIWFATRRPSLAQPAVAQFELPPPGPFQTVSGSGGGRAVVSPNGEWIAIRLSDNALSTRLWLRRLSELTAQPLAGTEGVSDGARPIWSPDSTEIAFTTRTELKRVRVEGGSVQVIGRIPNPVAFNSRGGWSTAGDILFGDTSGRVYRASVTEGGGVSVFSEPDRGLLTVVHGFLNGTRTFLVGKRPPGGQTNGELYLESLDDGSKVKISDASSEARMAGANSLLYQVGNTIFAQRLDPRKRALEGTGVPVTTGAAAHQWSVSDNGVLVVVPNTVNLFRWRDRSGRDVGTVATAARWGNFDLDQSNSRVVARDGENGELWVIDLTKGSLERLTFAGGFNNDASWLPDHRRVVYSRGSGTGQITANTAEITGLGLAPEARFEDPEGVVVDDVSSDGRWVVYHRRPPASGEAVARSLIDKQEGTVVARCRGSLDEASFSPDSRWLAFNCDESGRPEVYVVPFMRDGDRLLVSSAGGVQPKWRGDGRELFFLSPDGTLHAVDLAERANRLSSSVPRPLFKTSIAASSAGTQYAADHLGQRFLFLESSATTMIRGIINWPRLAGFSP